MALNGRSWGGGPGNDVSPRSAKADAGARLYSPANRLRLHVPKAGFQFGSQCAPNSIVGNLRS